MLSSACFFKQIYKSRRSAIKSARQILHLLNSYIYFYHLNKIEPRQTRFENEIKCPLPTSFQKHCLEGYAWHILQKKESTVSFNIRETRKLLQILIMRILYPEPLCVKRYQVRTFSLFSLGIDDCNYMSYSSVIEKNDEKWHIF